VFGGGSKSNNKNSQSDNISLRILDASFIKYIILCFNYIKYKIILLNMQLIHRFSLVMIILFLNIIIISYSMQEFIVLFKEFREIISFSSNNNILLDLLDSHLMMSTSGQTGPRTGLQDLRILGVIDDSNRVESNNTEYVPLVKPQENALYIDITRKPLPPDFTPTSDDYNHLHQTVSHGRDKMFNHNLSNPDKKVESITMDAIWRDRFKTLHHLHKGDNQKISEDFSRDVFTCRHVLAENNMSSKLGVTQTAWSHVSLGRTKSDVMNVISSKLTNA